MTMLDHEALQKILKETNVIAGVGISLNPIRPSYYVARYLHLRGYRVIPVNPGHAGKELFGETIYADLASIPKDANVDMVDIFRQSAHVPPIVEMAIAELPSLRTVWMQIGVEHADARAKAESLGLNVIENRCPKIEHQRLFGELRKAGINTGIISARL